MRAKYSALPIVCSTALAAGLMGDMAGLVTAFGQEPTPAKPVAAVAGEAPPKIPAMKAIRELNGEVKVNNAGNATLVILHYIPVPKPIWQQLGTLETVEQVELEYSQISDDDLANIAKLKNLKVAAFYNNPITSKGLVHLAGLSTLQNLGLNQTRVDSSGIKHLTGLTHLEKLWLDNSPVGDEAIDDLAKLKQLQHLGLRGTQMTAEGIDKLKQLMPDTAIHFAPPTAAPAPAVTTEPMAENATPTTQTLPQPAPKRRHRGRGRH